MGFLTRGPACEGCGRPVPGASGFTSLGPMERTGRPPCAPCSWAWAGSCACMCVAGSAVALVGSPDVERACCLSSLYRAGGTTALPRTDVDVFGATRQVVWKPNPIGKLGTSRRKSGCHSSTMISCTQGHGLSQRAVAFNISPAVASPVALALTPRASRPRVANSS